MRILLHSASLKTILFFYRATAKMTDSFGTTEFGNDLESESDEDYIPSEDEEPTSSQEIEATKETCEQDPILKVEVANSKDYDDNFWLDFLDGKANNSKASTSSNSGAVDYEEPTASTVDFSGQTVDSDKEQQKNVQKQTETYDFAGEEVKVEKIGPAKLNTQDSRPVKRTSAGHVASVKSKPSGLSGALGAIAKKQKMSTLEKSRLDWTNFKTERGISEEVETHNKGKEGFLDKQEFLSRSDYRQFEIEKGIRQKTRGNQ